MTQKLRCLVVDDEPLGRERIRTLIGTRTDAVVLAEASDGAEATDLLNSKEFDLVFLDIQMPRQTGFDVIREVGIERMPPVIFVTAFDAHALEAFEVHAIDYLLKPFDASRFHESVDRVATAKEHAGDPELNERIGKLLKGLDSRQENLSRIMVRTGDKIRFVSVNEIEWIEAAGNYANLHVGSREVLIRQTMKSLEKRLDPETFIRIHRSTIVNVDCIREITPTFNGDYEVTLSRGDKLTLSRSHRSALDRFA
ncbi:MAG: response regulator transcription factor [Bacteroidetes bacterium]|nr:response regulator transcription factor [Bacteroidota bacterium]